MNASSKTIGIAVVVALIIGFCIGFFPEHSKVLSQQAELATMTQNQAGAQTQLGQAHNQITLDTLTIQSATAYADAEQNNFSVASAAASAFFTSLRQYTDATQDAQMKQSFTEILGNRDRTIAALAQANPAVKTLLGEIFGKMQAVRAHLVQTQA